MGNRVKFWRYTVHNHNQIVHEWTPWETIDALRIRYAPRAEILGDARVSAFLVLLYTHTIPTNAFFSVPTKNRYARESALFTASK